MIAWSPLCLHYLESKKYLVGLSVGGNLMDAPILAETERGRKEFTPAGRNGELLKSVSYLTYLPFLRM